MTEKELKEYKRQALTVEKSYADDILAPFTRFPHACHKIITPARMKPENVPNDRELIACYLLAAVNEGARNIKQIKNTLGKYAFWADDPELTGPALAYLETLRKTAKNK